MCVLVFDIFWVCVNVNVVTRSKFMCFLVFNFFSFVKIDKLKFFFKLDANVPFFIIILLVMSASNIDYQPTFNQNSTSSQC